MWTSNVVLAEIVRRPSEDPPPHRGSPDFLAKSLEIPAINTKFKLKFVCEKLEFRIYMARITSNLAKKFGDRAPPRGLSIK